MREGLPLTQQVLFSSGFPDGDLSWVVSDETSSVVASGAITPTTGAVSVVINVSAGANQLASGTLYGWRDIAWVYSVGGVQEAGEERYTLEGVIPFGVRTNGVRSKLGISANDLGDDDIPLLKAYLDFESLVTLDLLSAVDITSAYNVLTICDAIEAFAALSVLPSLQVRIAASESSGTNQYKRMSVDWSVLADRLRALVITGQSLADPSADASFSTADLFVLTTPTDLFPGG